MGYPQKQRMRPHLKLGTRQSPLAMAQAHIIADQLSKQATVEIIPMLSEGDQNKTQPLHEIGGKGVFIKTLENALINNDIDMAVHSLKDVTSTLHPNTMLACFCDPESQADALIWTKSKQRHTLEMLPQNSRVATSSLRRKALIKQLRPDIHCIPIRGNIQTRIEQCEQGLADALILSEAGLIRLNLQTEQTTALDTNHFIPAPGQGVITVQCRKNEPDTQTLLESIGSTTQANISAIELDVLQKVGLDCNYPFGMKTSFSDTGVTIKLFWATQTLSQRFQETIQCTQDTLSAALAPVIAKIKDDIQ